MKKIILTIAIVLGIGFGVSAQSDAFFTQSFSEYRNTDEVTPALPYAHNLEAHQPAAPLGSGLLILAGLGLGYATLRKKS
ncbi:MAG: hypothetical protein E7067_00365 [Lentimicrobiaceae bacterium]|nr:hypothetical protein [Lentimicrobiaceae bacterium]